MGRLFVLEDREKRDWPEPLLPPVCLLLLIREEGARGPAGPGLPVSPSALERTEGGRQQEQRWRPWP